MRAFNSITFRYLPIAPGRSIYIVEIVLEMGSVVEVLNSMEESVRQL